MQLATAPNLIIVCIVMLGALIAVMIEQTISLHTVIITHESEIFHIQEDITDIKDKLDMVYDIVISTKK